MHVGQGMAVVLIGLFLTPLALGLAVIGMPDRRNLS